jgi:hypothetical protein
MFDLVATAFDGVNRRANSRVNRIIDGPVASPDRVDD